ncbi:MAG TPA: hypothetical protein VFE55_11400 [Acidimicrobiia bacterium]|nr:hypothetical protein [Acidimicrobiia bacterium]
MPRRGVLAGLVLLVAGGAVAGGIGAASGDTAPLVFSGEATASGVRVTVQAKNTPVTNTPFDAGAPTAYAQLDTIGGSNAYAAYPFPGTVFQSGPGLAVGLLNQSGVPVPSPPNFPNYVASDGTTPSSESGSGPYHLKATSSPAKADALATGGIRSDGGGSVGFATATSTVESSGAAGAVAVAVSRIESVVIGPLTIGSVRSSVTVNLAPDGTATPKTELAVSGVRINGVPVSVTQDGLAAGGATVPFTTDPALAAALAQAGLKVELVAARPVDKGAVAPALRITTPVPTPGFGDGTGQMILVFGGASAAFSSFVAPLPDVVPPAAAGPAQDNGAAGPSRAGAGGGSVADGAAGPVGAPMTASAGVRPSSGDRAGGAPAPVGDASTGAAVADVGTTAGAPGPAEVALRPGSRATGAPAVARRELEASFDIRDLYLAAAVLGLVALGMTTLLRHLGVRSA